MQENPSHSESNTVSDLVIIKVRVTLIFIIMSEVNKLPTDVSEVHIARYCLLESH